MTHGLKTYPRPLPKGALVEFAGERAKVVRDDGSTIRVNQAGQHMVWRWTFEGETIKVLRLPVFNMTPKRLAALKLIAEHPGCPVGYVAQHVLCGEWKTENGHRLWPQQATRAGAAYCLALKGAGLVTIKRAEIGFGDVTLTDAGRAAIK